MGFIYLVTNSINGKMYVGQTIKTPTKRWNEHCSEAKICRDDNYFHNAIRKYGKDAFTVKVLESNIPKNMLNDRESFWIAKYKTFGNGYNLTSGGGQAFFVSAETRTRIGNSVRGEKNGFYGRKHNLTTLGTCKRVYQFNQKGELVGEYISTGEAARITGFDFSKIAAVCRGGRGRRSYRGFVWSYLNEEPSIHHLRKIQKAKTPVRQLTKDGKLVQQFASAAEAAASLGKPHGATNITACCRGRLKSSCGFRWEYAEP